MLPGPCMWSMIRCRSLQRCGRSAMTAGRSLRHSAVTFRRRLPPPSFGAISVPITAGLLRRLSLESQSLGEGSAKRQISWRAGMSSEVLRNAIEQVCWARICATDHLTDLDQAIGDGDHGLNMKRGCEAVLADLDAIAAKPLPEALRAIGTHLV